MKKKIIIIFVFLILALVVCYFCLPFFEFRKDNKLYVFSREESYGEFEDNLCYSESVSYNEKRDISITDWEIEKLPLGIYMLVLEYEEGNLCDSEYILDESYILDVIENAEIIYNDDDINLEELIKDREAIVSNTRYHSDDYSLFMTYKLNGKFEELYIFYVDDLLVIQVGNSDEGPKFIAYE